jgi:hypothetical protein
VSSGPRPARWRRLLGEARGLIATVAQEMEAVYEQRSERWQESERGEAHLAHGEALRELLTCLEELEGETLG